MNGKAAPAKVPEGGFDSCLDFHRRELVRQRDLLRSVWSWYLGPLVPGMVVFLFGSILQKVRQPTDWLKALPVAAFMAAGFWFTARLNRRAAGCLQRQIEELDRVAEQ
jgi:positive regulator of sigma E activity